MKLAPRDKFNRSVRFVHQKSVVVALDDVIDVFMISNARNVDQAGVSNQLWISQLIFFRAFQRNFVRNRITKVMKCWEDSWSRLDLVAEMLRKPAGRAFRASDSRPFLELLKHQLSFHRSELSIRCKTSWKLSGT